MNFKTTRLNRHEQYMHRCIELARRGAGFTAPNPMVGAVLVYEGRIIGEGWHQQYGGPHAEVNCINTVSEEDRILISQSVLYVSLEPCAHFGKTPPCADLIIKNKIPHVVIGCRDPFKAVDGKGIERLKSAGVGVEPGVLEKECQELNKRFFTFHTKQRPFILLKWAQTNDGKISAAGKERLMISNEYSNRLVHAWRSEEASILVGTNTAVVDNPQLSNRLWPGHNPVRLVIDLDLKLSPELNLFDQSIKTIVFNTRQNREDDKIVYYQVARERSIIPQILNALYRLNIQSVMVEGGAALLQSFIDDSYWDEARVISNRTLTIGSGISAPQLFNAEQFQTVAMQDDQVVFYRNREDQHQ